MVRKGPELFAANKFYHFAMKYINSPKPLSDEQSDILLSIVEPDKKTLTTRCKLYYRVVHGVTVDTQLLGFVDIYVGDIIKNWVKKGIEKIYYKENRTPAEERLLKKWYKKDWYVAYQIRKKRKVDFINKHGIFRTADIDYADVYLRTVELLMPLTKFKGGIEPKRVKATLKTVCRQMKIPTSIIGDQLMSDRAESVLNYFADKHDFERKVDVLIQKHSDGKVDDEAYEEETKSYYEAIKRLEKLAEEQMKELKFLRKVKEEFYDT